MPHPKTTKAPANLPARLLTPLLCAVLLSACVQGSGSRAAADETAALYGYYEFEETVYISPLSSFLPLKGSMPAFAITETALRLIDSEGGTEQEYAAVYEKEPLEREEFAALFSPGLGSPDLSGYVRLCRYAVFTAEDRPEYRLYLADGEVWLVSLQGSTIWSVYRLTKTGEIEPEPTPAPQTDDPLPQSVTVVSGTRSAAALVYREGAELTPREAETRVSYLEIDPGADVCFRVYADGTELFGDYEIYDAETFAALEFIRPSGLVPQTYLLQNAKPGHSYIVSLTTGYTSGGKTFGMKLLFGVTA